MKKIVALTFFAVLFQLNGCSTTNEKATPLQVVEIFFDSYSRCDGNTLVSCMSDEAIADIDDYVLTLQETPEASAEYLNSIGIQVTTEDIETLTAGNFVTLIFNSPVYADELPDFSSAEFGEATIVDNRAIVPVTIDNNTEPIELIIENDEWKIVGNNMKML